MKETPDKIKKGKLEFQVIYSRKIEGSVAALSELYLLFSMVLPEKQ